MDNILIAATTIAVFVLAFTEFIKRYAGTESKWLPLINLFVGLVIGVAWSLSFDPSNLVNFVWGGAVAGLAAGGFYDLGVSALRKGDSDV
ncbi:holin [Enterococcus larvae]|uniref:holin n=1 Tax=Enterococcus larvae TaxID=2794352 RepID=UPI003F349BB0